MDSFFKNVNKTSSDSNKKELGALKTSVDKLTKIVQKQSAYYKQDLADSKETNKLLQQLVNLDKREDSRERLERAEEKRKEQKEEIKNDKKDRETSQDRKERKERERREDKAQGIIGKILNALPAAGGVVAGLTGFGENQRGGPVYNRQRGGPLKVPGTGSGDKVPMLLPEGSFVLNRNASKTLFRQKGGMVKTMLEPGERVYGPGEWGSKEESMNQLVPRFGESKRTGNGPPTEDKIGQGILGLQKGGKVFLHWAATGYTGASDFYHATVQGDGSVEQTRDYNKYGGAHTSERSHEGVGISLAAMKGATDSNFGSYPVKPKQYESMAKLVAKILKDWGVGPEYVTRSNVLTHAEAGTDGDSKGNYGPRPQGGTGERWDLWKLYESDPNGTGGDRIRSMIKAAMNNTRMNSTDETGESFDTTDLKQNSHPETGRGWQPLNLVDKNGRPLIFSLGAARAFLDMYQMAGPGGSTVSGLDVWSTQRSKKYNKMVDGADGSNHLTGNAMDIHGKSKDWLKTMDSSGKYNSEKYHWKNLVYSGHDGHFDYNGPQGGPAQSVASSPSKEGNELTSSDLIGTPSAKEFESMLESVKKGGFNDNVATGMILMTDAQIEAFGGTLLATRAGKNFLMGGEKKTPQQIKEEAYMGMPTSIADQSMGLGTPDTPPVPKNISLSDGAGTMTGSANQKAILDAIAVVEGTKKGGYGTMFGGRVDKDLAAGKLTVRQAYNMAMNNPGSEATGRYQFMGQTFKDMVNWAKIASWDDKFTPALQDEMAMWLIEKKRGVNLSDGLSMAEMQGIAKEWASVEGGNYKYKGRDQAKYSKSEFLKMYKDFGGTIQRQTGGLVSTLLEPGETVGSVSQFNEAIPRFGGVGDIEGVDYMKQINDYMDQMSRISEMPMTNNIVLENPMSTASSSATPAGASQGPPDIPNDSDNSFSMQLVMTKNLLSASIGG